MHHHNTPAPTPPHPHTHQHTQRAAALQAATYSDRLLCLQLALHDATRHLTTTTTWTPPTLYPPSLTSPTTPTRISPLHAAQGPLLSALGSLLRTWEGLLALQDQLAEEEAQLFKTKTTDIRTEDEEDEAAFQTAFPDVSGAFADLARLDEDVDGSGLNAAAETTTSLLGGLATQQQGEVGSKPNGGEGDGGIHAAQKAEGSSVAAKELLQGGALLLDVVQTYTSTMLPHALPQYTLPQHTLPQHTRINNKNQVHMQYNALSSDNTEDTRLTNFDRRYALGQRALTALQYVVPGVVDAGALEGHLLFCSRRAAHVGAPLPPRAADAQGSGVFLE